MSIKVTGIIECISVYQLTFLPKEVHKICLANVPIVSVDVVILNHLRNKVLLFKRNNNPLKGVYYTLGGRVFKNESIIDTATRKLNEEAGLIVQKKELFFGGVMEEFFENSIYKNIDTHNVNIFLGYIAYEKFCIRLDEQHTKYEWFNITSNSLHPQVRYKIDLIYNKECFFYDPGTNLSIFGKQQLS